MKEKVFYALACVLCLTGCNSSSPEEIINLQTEVTPICFSLQMEKEILPFPATRSIPPNPIPEPSTSKAGEDVELNELCSTIEYVVFKNEEEPLLHSFVKHKQFVYDNLAHDMDFGIVYDSLPQGNYTFYFLAHNSKSATRSDISFSFDSISDTFYETFSLEIGVAEVVSRDISMQRIVGRIEFMAIDTVSNKIKEFQMEIDGISDRLDLSSGEGIKNPEKKTFSYTFSEEEIGEANKTHAFYTFIPATETKMAARLSALAHDGTQIRERQVNDITPEKSKIIRYKGRLYSRSESDDTFQIGIYNNGEWKTEEDVELPEYDK